MAKKWQGYDPGAGGHGGEQTAAAPLAFDPSELAELRNALLTGPGVVEQKPDFLLADVCEDLASAEVEGVAGIFPFSTQGDAAAASEGVVFSFDLGVNKIYLHQLNENHVIQRTIVVATDYAPSVPPQITGFQINGKFFYCIYGQEVATSRLGMGYFDPAGIVAVTSSSAANPSTITTASDHGLATGEYVTISGHSLSGVNTSHQITYLSDTTFSIPVMGGGTGGKIYCRRPRYDLDAVAGTGLLLFRGICLHRGATILGWGYRQENDADRGEFLRWSKYGDDLVWEGDLTDTEAGGYIVGIPGLEVVACAAAGQYTVIGKENEVYLLDGDYSAQFYSRRIAEAHGPVSTVGMVSIGDAALWMSNEGPVICREGAKPELLGLDRLYRRMLRYMDLKKCWAAYDDRRERVGWLLRRSVDEDDNPLADSYPSEILWCDLQRGRPAFYVEPLPTTAWSIGTTKGPGLTLSAPSGVLTLDAASALSQRSFRVNFTPADTNPGTSYIIEYRPNGSSTWVLAGEVYAGTTHIDITGLEPSTVYDVRGKQVRNGQSSAYATTASYATTLAESAVVAPPNPTNVQVISQRTDDPYTISAQVEITVGFDPNHDAGVWVKLFAHDSNDSSAATEVGSISTAGYGSVRDRTLRSVGETIYYWVQFIGPAGAASSKVALTSQPYTVEPFSDLL